MSETSPVKDVTIELSYGSRFRRQVEEGSGNPLMGMNVIVDGRYVKGGPDPSQAAESHMTTHLRRQLAAASGMLDGEKQIVEYSDGPTYLVFEPEDSDGVRITGCVSIDGARNPDDRLPIDEGAVVDKQAWVTELVRAAEEYYDILVDENPELAEHEWFESLREEIDETKALVRDFESEGSC